MELRIGVTGKVRCVYSEVIDLAELGPLRVRRASHVEPDRHGNWQLDLQPVGGPVLGPFRLRSEALLAENAWLTAHWLRTECDF